MMAVKCSSATVVTRPKMRRLVLQFRQSRIQIRVHGRHIVAGLLDLIVQMAVLAAVGRLLLDEGIDLPLLLRRHAITKIPYALDEKCFALWKGERQAIVKRRGNGIAAVPPTLAVRPRANITLRG